MNYNELVQLYFERSTAMQSYWNLYVVILGGMLAFSSMRKQPAAITTLIVSILFVLFAYNNLDAMHDTTNQRFAVLHSIKEFNAGDTAATNKPIRDQIEPTLTPATFHSVWLTHVISDVLAIAGLWAMEMRRRRISGDTSPAS